MKYFLFFFAATFIVSCSSTKEKSSMSSEVQKSSSGGLGATLFDKQGHRGCRGFMPENTIPAMLKALDLGVATLEMDVVFTKDNICILSHEPFFNHEITTKNNGDLINEAEEKNYNIYKMSFAETQQYDVGMKPHPRFTQQKKIAVTKPSLAAVFDSVTTYMMTRRRPFPIFNIETKTTASTDNIFHPAPQVFVDMLMKVIDEKQLRPFVIIQSFDVRTLQHLHKKYSDVSTALLVEDYDKKNFDEQVTQLGFAPSIYSAHYSLVNEALIKKCHQQKVKVIPWTVNDKAEIERLKKMGVDGIITDYPNLFNE
jgi:glycerophosphoryl diester phosphodiesterase